MLFWKCAHILPFRGPASREIQEIATKASFWELKAPFALYSGTRKIKLEFKIKHILLLKPKVPISVYSKQMLIYRINNKVYSKSFSFSFSFLRISVSHEDCICFFKIIFNYKNNSCYCFSDYRIECVFSNQTCHLLQDAVCFW